MRSIYVPNQEIRTGDRFKCCDGDTITIIRRANAEEDSRMDTGDSVYLVRGPTGEEFLCEHGAMEIPLDHKDLIEKRIAELTLEIDLLSDYI